MYCAERNPGIRCPLAVPFVRSYVRWWKGGSPQPCLWARDGQVTAIQGAAQGAIHALRDHDSRMWQLVCMGISTAWTVERDVRIYPETASGYAPHGAGRLDRRFAMQTILPSAVFRDLRKRSILVTGSRQQYVLVSSER